MIIDGIDGNLMFILACDYCKIPLNTLQILLLMSIFPSAGSMSRDKTWKLLKVVTCYPCL